MSAHPLLLKPTTAAATSAPKRAAGAAPLSPTASERQRILLPYDGTPSSARALDHVLELARWRELFVHLLNVQPPVMAGDVTLFTSARAVELARRAAGERALAAARAALSASGVRYLAEVAFGSAAGEIVRCATSSGCDKVVMGTHRQGLLARLLGRSVAYRVLRCAPVPVTLIPLPPRSVARPARQGFAHAFASAQRLGAWRKRCCSETRAYRAPSRASI